MKRLRPEADAVDAVVGQYGDLGVVERVGVGFDAPFAARLQRQPSPHGRQQPCQLSGGEMRGRASADEDRSHRLRIAKVRHLRVEGVEILVNEMVLSDGDGEVAIAALVGAEWHMEVGGVRPDPRWCFIQGGFSGKGGAPTGAPPTSLPYQEPTGPRPFLSPE